MTVLGHIRRWRLLGALFAVAAVTGLALAGSLRAALPGVDEIAFHVFRDGAPLGHHRVSFRREGGELHVEIDVALEVRLLFLTVLRYRHKNHEVWRGGRLVAIDTETDDDGEAFWLRGRATESGLAVEGSSGAFLAPADVLPNVSATAARSQPMLAAAAAPRHRKSKAECRLPGRLLQLHSQVPANGRPDLHGGSWLDAAFVRRKNRCYGAVQTEKPSLDLCHSVLAMVDR